MCDVAVQVGFFGLLVKVISAIPALLDHMEDECTQGADRKKREEHQLEQQEKVVNDLRTEVHARNINVDQHRRQLADADMEITRRKLSFDEECSKIRQEHEQGMKSARVSDTSESEPETAQSLKISEAQNRLDADLLGLEAAKESAASSLRDVEAGHQRLAGKLEKELADLEQLRAVSAAEQYVCTAYAAAYQTFGCRHRIDNNGLVSYCTGPLSSCQLSMATSRRDMLLTKIICFRLVCRQRLGPPMSCSRRQELSLF